MSNQESDSSSESFSDIVLPSISTPTSVGTLINDFLIDLSPDANFNLISYFTSINKEKIAQIYAESNSKLNVRMCGMNEFFTNLPSKGEQPSFREGFCCVEIPNFTLENPKNESKSSSSKSRSKSSNSIQLFPKYTPSIAIFGGKSESNLLNSELYTYSLITNTWKKISLISTELNQRVGHRAVALNKDEHTFIYVFGGTNGFYLEDNLLLICLCGDFASCSIIECEGPNKPCGRCDHSMTLVTDLYSSFQLEANNPSSSQSVSSTSQSPPAISIPSISSFPEIASIVQSDTSNTTFEDTTNSFNATNSGPAWALVFGGKISNESSNIDLARKFNDKNQEKVLCDLWKLELRDPFDVPRWTLISREGPPGRHSHAAFCKDGQFFIAGGYDEKGLPLKDVWRYTFGFGWEEIAVFNNNSIINIFGSPKYGFVQIKSQKSSQKEDNSEENLYVSPLKMDPALVLLSDEFDKLRKKQRMMWNSISEKMEEIDLLEIEIENGKRFIKNPEAFSNKSKSKSKNSKENENLIGINFISDISKVKKLEEQVRELRFQLFNESKQNIASKKAKIEYPKEVCPKLADFTLDLYQKIALKTEKFQKRKRELDSEIQLYTNQKKLLENFKPTGEKNQSSKELFDYTDKLRELETFKDKTIQAEKKLDRMRRKQVLDDQYIMTLIDEVSKCENKIIKTDKEILKWEAIVERSKIENKMANSILKVWQAGNQSPDQQQQPSKSKSKSKSKPVDSEKVIQKILKSNNSLRSKIKEELKSFLETKNSSFQFLVSSIDSILSTIDDSKQLADCKSSILEKTANFSQAIDVLEAPFSKF